MHTAAFYTENATFLKENWANRGGGWPPTAPFESATVVCLTNLTVGSASSTLLTNYVLAPLYRVTQKSN